MGIDINRLSPWAQKQIAQKIAANATQTAREQRNEQSKYRNIPEKRIAQNATIRFSSKAEAKRYDELMLMLKAGKIRDLRLQQDFTLQEAYTTPQGERIRAIRYKADFVYERLVGYYTDVAPRNIAKWEKVVEDTKGGKATQTPLYKMKKKMLMDKYGIEIQEIE